MPSNKSLAAILACALAWAGAARAGAEPLSADAIERHAIALHHAAAGNRDAGGGAADAPDLPPRALVQATLSALPEVRSAAQLRRAAMATRDRLLAGPGEWQVRTSGTRRQVSGVGSADVPGNFNEWEVAVERPWRSDRKATIDRRLGEAEVARADNALGDAVHEAARGLLRRWFELRRLQSERLQLEAQRESWEQTRASVARRVEAGDAARLDLDLLLATLAQADARLADIGSRASQAQVEFEHAYPELAGFRAAAQCEPRREDRSLDDYMSRLLAEHHELAMAQAELDRRLQLAERARADQSPDATVGVRIASERGGAEHLAGLVVTLPLGGAARDAATRAALAEAEAAREQLLRVRRRLEGEVTGLYASREGIFLAWAASRSALERTSSVAARSQRAYALGEIGLSELLGSRRQEQEARLQEALARNNACETSYRLELDTHGLWAVAVAEFP